MCFDESFLAIVGHRPTPYSAKTHYYNWLVAIICKEMDSRPVKSRLINNLGVIGSSCSIACRSDDDGQEDILKWSSPLSDQFLRHNHVKRMEVACKRGPRKHPTNLCSPIQWLYDVVGVKKLSNLAQYKIQRNLDEYEKDSGMHESWRVTFFNIILLDETASHTCNYMKRRIQLYLYNGGNKFTSRDS